MTAKKFSNKKNRRFGILNHVPGKIAVVLVLFLLVTISGCTRESSEEVQDILQKIRALPGVTAVEIVPYYDYPRAFRIDITQPVDHNNPAGQQFTQRMYLSHVDESLPMVFAPSGYAVNERSGQELAGILQSNCLNVTHRYFEGARPDPTDWQYLTIRQAAADHHEIVTLFKTIYTGPWVSAGASKSGLTPLFHKRFYPDDVEAVVAYVAPFMFGTADERYVDYIANIGTQEAREQVHAFQRQALENRGVLTPMFVSWFGENGYTLTGDPDRRFEDMVLGYGWNYWQYRSRFTTGIPGPNATPEEMLEHLDEVAIFFRSSDEDVVYIQPWLHQAGTEIGYPAMNYDHVQDLLLYDQESLSEAYLRVYGFPLEYNAATIEDIYRWVREEGNNIIFIYGSDDPWSAGAVELTGQTNALIFFHPGGDHRVQINDLAERDLLLATLENWLGIQIERTQYRGIMVVPPMETETLNMWVMRGDR